MNNESFVFYKSFFEAIEMVSEESQLDIYKAICNYCFNGEEPNGIDSVAKAMFILIKPNLDSANKRYRASVENGKKGGRPKGNDNTKKQPNHNPTITQQEPNHNLNDNVDVDYNDNYNDNDNKDYNDEDNNIVCNNTSSNNIYITMFNEFWEAYPRKVNKQKALSTFMKLKPTEELFAKIMWALQNQKQSSQWQKDNGQFIPHPSTWLNGSRWEDEVVEQTIENKIDEAFANNPFARIALKEKVEERRNNSE